MAYQPQISIEDYNPGVSVALFSQPQDFFRPYSQYLKQIGGKFNYNLRGRPGWIFSKSREQELRQTVSQIVSGQMPARAQPTYGPSAPATQQGLAGILQANQPMLAAPMQAKFPPPGESPIVQPFPISMLPGAVPSGYQQVIVTVPRPEAGKTLLFETGGQKFPVTVESVQQSGGIVDAAVIQLSDGQRTQIKLEGSEWKIPGFAQPHSISVPM